MDADFYSTETASIKNALTQDIVRGPKGFEKPAGVNEKVKIDCSKFSFEDLEDAIKTQKCCSIYQDCWTRVKLYATISCVSKYFCFTSYVNRKMLWTLEICCKYSWQ